LRRVLETLIFWCALLGSALLLLGPGDSSARRQFTEIDARSTETFRVCSRVRARSGPDPVAEVRLFHERSPSVYAAAGVARTERGVACLDRVPRGLSWILAEAPGFARAAAKLSVQGDVSHELTLEPESKLGVLVLDELGQPIARATVLVTAADPVPFGALTNAEGKAEIGRLPPAPWKVRAHALGFESASSDDVVRDLRLVLRRLSAIDVRVLANGEPVDGAAVLIAGSSLWPARRAQTDAAGIARIRGLSEGSYDLRASHESLVSPTLHGFELGRGVTETVTLELAPGRIVTALVTDGESSTALGVAGADVVLVEAGVASFPLQGRTNKDGKVTLGPIAPGPATLSARATDFVGGPLVVVPDVVTEPVRVPLIRGGRLRGEVVDDRGFPIEGAGIEIIGTDRFGLPIAETPLVNRFRAIHFEWSLGGPPPLIPAGELGVMPGPVPPIPHGPAFAALAPTATATGVAAEPPPAPWITNKSGEFDARPITPGRVRALVRHPDYVETTSELVAVSSGGEARVKVVLLRGGAVDGRVLDDRGFPVEGAPVLLIAERGTFERREFTRGDGAFSFTAAPSRVTLSVARPEDPGRNVVIRALDVPENGRIELDLTLPKPREAVRITVVDAAGDPIELAEVRALSLAPDVPLRKTLFTGEDGRLELPDAAGLPLRLLFDAPRFSAIEKIFDSAPAEVRVELDAGVLISGRVTAVRGRSGVPSAIVSLRGAVQRRSTSSDADGFFRFDSVAPGPIEIRVSHPDYADESMAFEVTSTGRADRPLELEPIDLQEPGAIEGRVVDASGNPVSGARVGENFVPTYVPEGALPAGMALSDSNGDFVLRGLKPGPRRLSAYAPGVGRGSVDAVEVVAGRSAGSVTIRLSDVSIDNEPFATGGLAVTLGEQRDGDAVSVVVVDVTAGSEAERGGLHKNDVLTQIDGQKPSSMDDARLRLAGRAGTDVVLEVTRDSGDVRLRVTRQAVRR
jgi:hypothetical protein